MKEVRKIEKNVDIMKVPKNTKMDSQITKYGLKVSEKSRIFRILTTSKCNILSTYFQPVLHYHQQLFIRIDIVITVSNHLRFIQPDLHFSNN